MDFEEESFVRFRFGGNCVHPKSCGDLRLKLDLSLVLLLSEVGPVVWPLRFPER
jgi:hypothetical protein